MGRRERRTSRTVLARGVGFICIQVMHPHQRHHSNAPPLASERTSAMALMMTNSNNRWKAHRPNGRPPSLPPPGAVRKGGRCHADGRGRSFNKAGKFLHKSTQSCSIGRSLRSFPASISATPGTKKHSGSAIRPLFSCRHQFGTLSYNRNKLQSRIHFETA